MGHHYLPEVYLEGFTDPLDQPHIWIYEKGKQLVRPGTKETVGQENDYHSFKRPDGVTDTGSIEKYFCALEGKAADVIR